MILLKSLLNEGDAREFFRIPGDYKTNYPEYHAITFSKDFTLGFAYIPLSKLSAAGVPSDVGDHVKKMEKMLKSGKKVKFEPIAVMITKNGKFEVQDGNTRVLTLKRMGYGGKIPAVVAAWKPSQLKSLETF